MKRPTATTRRNAKATTIAVAGGGFGSGSKKIWLVAVVVLVSVSLVLMSVLPVILIEKSIIPDTSQQDGLTENDRDHVSPHKVVGKSMGRTATNGKTRTTKDGRTLMDVSLSDLLPDQGFADRPIARGVAGRPVAETPAVATARRATIQCDINVDSLAYWNVDERDHEFQSPFAVSTNPGDKDQEEEKFITFTPDRGGWNNIRMSLEIIFVIAAATGRTLVLPPKEPLYLMHLDKNNRYRGFADFFPMEKVQKRVKTISFAEYIQRTNAPQIPEDIQVGVRGGADHCDRRDKSSASCSDVNQYLERTGTLVNISASHTCLVFDEESYQTAQPPTDADSLAHVQAYCGKRQIVYWNAKQFRDPTVLFFDAGKKEFRLLCHFYGMIHFTRPDISHYYKRFVRDYLHYHDAIYCAAGKIVKAVQAEGMAKYGHTVDAEGAGAFSSMHVRRGDLQYKKVKISAQEWYDNTQEVWLKPELLYIATDERDKGFFDDLAKHHELRFLDDYWDLAGLGELDPNYMGMIDTIVASRGRAFAGTWFSTFSGYINRLRGYHGMSMKDSWYSFLPKKTAVHEWRVVDDMAYAFEWPDGWAGIDADVWPERDVF